MSPTDGPLAVAVVGRGIVDPDTPIIHADDRGLLRGLAAFETLRVYGGRPFALREHLDRLARSGARMGLRIPPADELSAIAELALDHAGRPDCGLRFTVTGGRGADGEPVAIASVLPLPADLETVRAAGISLITLELGVDPRIRREAPWLLDGVKSTSYAVNMAAWDEARRRGADDAVFVAAEGSVLEGPVTNVWWRAGTTLRTPALDLGILAGVTRAWVLRLASDAGYGTEEGWFDRSELTAADEIFTSSSVREIMPVVAIDGRRVGDGRPGRAAVALQAALRRAARAGGDAAGG